jgi:hypothetical protein
MDTDDIGKYLRDTCCNRCRISRRRLWWFAFRFNPAFATWKGFVVLRAFCRTHAAYSFSLVMKAMMSQGVSKNFLLRRRYGIFFAQSSDLTHLTVVDIIRAVRMSTSIGAAGGDCASVELEVPETLIDLFILACGGQLVAEASAAEGFSLYSLTMPNCIILPQK